MDFTSFPVDGFRELYGSDVEITDSYFNHRAMPGQCQINKGSDRGMKNRVHLVEHLFHTLSLWPFKTTEIYDPVKQFWDLISGWAWLLIV